MNATALFEPSYPVEDTSHHNLLSTNHLSFLKMDELKPYLDQGKAFLSDLLEKSQPFLDSIGPCIQTLCDDILKAINSWDYITIIILVVLLIAALPSILWIGMYTIHYSICILIVYNHSQSFIHSFHSSISFLCLYVSPFLIIYSYDYHPSIYTILNIHIYIYIYIL